MPKLEFLVTVKVRFPGENEQEMLSCYDATSREELLKKAEAELKGPDALVTYLENYPHEITTVDVTLTDDY